jgi:hypothetical protein
MRAPTQEEAESSLKWLDELLDGAGLAIDNDGRLYKTRNVRENLGITPKLALAWHLRNRE